MSNTDIKPKDISDSEMLSSNLFGILPDYKDIPEDFKRQANKWVQWQQEWFFNGLKQMPKPKVGIDLKKAMRHLKCIQASFAPKHEHKEAGVAYLASLWFEE